MLSMLSLLCDTSVSISHTLGFQRSDWCILVIPMIWLVNTWGAIALFLNGGQRPHLLFSIRVVLSLVYLTAGALTGLLLHCVHWSTALLSVLWLVHTCEPSALVGRAWFSWHRRPGTSPGARGRRAPRRSRATGAPPPRTETIKEKSQNGEK